MFPLVVILVQMIAFAPGLASEIQDRSQIPPLDQRDLYVHYELSKDSFLVAERIYLKYWIENLSTQTQYYRLEDFWEFSLADGLGRPREVDKGWPHMDYVLGEFVPEVGDGCYRALAAHGNTKRMSFNVLEHYGDGHSVGDLILPPGRYSLYATRSVSDTVHFVVTPPGDANEIELVDRLTRFHQTYSDWTNSEKLIPFYESLLDLAPRSVYAPKLLDDLISWYKFSTTLRDSAKVQEYSLRLIDEFPNSPSVIYALREIEVDQLTPEQKTVFSAKLKIVKQNFPGGSTERIADSLLTRLSE